MRVPDKWVPEDALILLLFAHFMFLGTREAQLHIKAIALLTWVLFYYREFSDHFCNLMIQTMTEGIKGSHVAEDVLFEEVRSHAVFCLEKAEQVFGKDEILKQV